MLGTCVVGTGQSELILPAGLWRRVPSTLGSRLSGHGMAMGPGQVTNITRAPPIDWGATDSGLLSMGSQTGTDLGMDRHRGSMSVARGKIHTGADLRGRQTYRMIAWLPLFATFAFDARG